MTEDDTRTFCFPINLKNMHYVLCFALIIHNTKASAEAHSIGAVGRMARAIQGGPK